MGILGKTIGELRDLNLGGNFAPAASYGYGWDARQRNDKTLETVLNELQETAK